MVYPEYLHHLAHHPNWRIIEADHVEPGKMLKINNDMYFHRETLNQVMLELWGWDVWLKYRFQRAESEINKTINRAVEKAINRVL